MSLRDAKALKIWEFKTLRKKMEKDIRKRQQEQMG